MRVDIGMKRYATKEDRKRAMIRRATTMSSTTHNVAGREKTGKRKLKPITLPKLKFSDLAEV